MNPLTNVKNIAKLNEQELKLGIGKNCSWHKIYKDSPWIFIGGLDYDLTEGDVICVFSQYGEVEDINLVRDKKSGKSKGFCFLSYQNNTSTILAVDNLNGIKLCGRTIRVDHVADYRPPKENKDEEKKEKSDEDTNHLMKLVQDMSEGTKPKHKHYKSVTGNNAKELTAEKHSHKSAKNVPNEVFVDKGKTNTYRHRSRDSSREKSHQEGSSKHFNREDVNSFKTVKIERKSHSSSDESSSKYKPKANLYKYKESKSYCRKQSDSSSSDESSKHKLTKDKYQERKHFNRKHYDSSCSNESSKHRLETNKYKESKSFIRKQNDSSYSDESSKHTLKKDKYKESKPIIRKRIESSSSDESSKYKLKKDKYKADKPLKRKYSDSGSDESDERTKHKSKHKKHKHKSRHKNLD